MKYIALCIFCFLLSAVRGSAQLLSTSPGIQNSFEDTVIDYQTLMTEQFDFRMPLRHSIFQLSSGFKNYPSVNHLPGLFCKLEYKIETKSKLAPRFRLGSLAYTEWMEGKQEFYNRNYK